MLLSLLASTLLLLGFMLFRASRENKHLLVQLYDEQKQRAILEERIAASGQHEHHLTNTFKALSSDTLRSHSSSFLDLATTRLEKWQESAQGDLHRRQQAIQDLVKPLRESLEKVDHRMSELEKARAASFAQLDEKIQHITLTNKELRKETANLVQALRTPHIRGQWGEIQLKRVVEMAGMIEHCDFVLQESKTDESKRRLRPDLLIKLPNGRHIVVDAKTPLHGYLASVEAASDEERAAQLKSHARHVRTHIQQLSAKSYWDQFHPTPEFVVLFIPADPFFSAALQHDPELIEYGVEQKVIVATPSTLIALLRAVAYGWDHEKSTKNAEEICALGKTLYERLHTVCRHFVDVKKGLDKTVDSYNKVVRSMERRVLVTAQKFNELGIGKEKELPSLTEQQEAVESLITHDDA